MTFSAGAGLLILGGGINTFASSAVLLGIISPDGGFDPDAMIGHALFWDPLFLIWGTRLAAALWFYPAPPRGHHTAAKVGGRFRR